LWLGGHWTAYAHETNISTEAFMADPDYSHALGCYSFSTTVKCPHLIEKALQYLPLAEQYFGSEVQLFTVAVFWSFPGGPVKQIQEWHRDLCTFDDKQLAVYFYLTDVGLGEAHGYACGSWKGDEFGSICSAHQTLMEDCPRCHPSRVYITGQSGTLFIENPYGLHKGQKPNNQCRLMALARYGVSVPPAIPVEHGELWRRLDAKQSRTVRLIVRG
jgi:hypothetical protein